MKKEWREITQKIELPDRDMDVSIGFYAKGIVDIAKVQIEGNLLPISDKEILRRMIVRRVEDIKYRVLSFLKLV